MEHSRHDQAINRQFTDTEEVRGSISRQRSSGWRRRMPPGWHESLTDRWSWYADNERTYCQITGATADIAVIDTVTDRARGVAEGLPEPLPIAPALVATAAAGGFLAGFLVRRRRYGR